MSVRIQPTPPWTSGKAYGNRILLTPELDLNKARAACVKDYETHRDFKKMKNIEIFIEDEDFGAKKYMGWRAEAT